MGCPCDGGAQDTAGRRKRQNTGRRKDEQSSYCRTRLPSQGSPRQPISLLLLPSMLQAVLRTHSCLLPSSASQSSFPPLNHTPSFQLTFVGQLIQKKKKTDFRDTRCKSQKTTKRKAPHKPSNTFSTVHWDTKKQIHSLRSYTDINPSESCLISPHRNLITQLTTYQGGEIHLSLDACRKHILLLKGGSSDILERYI